MEYLGKNTVNAKKVLANAIANLPVEIEQAEFTILDNAE